MVSGRCLPLHEVDGLRHKFGVDVGADFPRVGLDGAQWTAGDGLDDLRTLRQQFFGYAPLECVIMVVST